MNDPTQGVLEDWDSSDDEVADAMTRAIGDALRVHKNEGVSIAVWDWVHDRVKIIPPEEIAISEADTIESPTELGRTRS